MEFTANLAPRKSMYFQSAKNQSKNTVVSLANLWLSNGHISLHLHANLAFASNISREFAVSPYLLTV